MWLPDLTFICWNVFPVWMHILKFFVVFVLVVMTKWDVPLLHFAVNGASCVLNACLAGSSWCFRCIYIWMLGKINVCLVGCLSTQEFHKIHWNVSEAVVGKTTVYTRAACWIAILWVVLSYWKLSMKRWHWMLNLTCFYIDFGQVVSDF